MKRVGHWWLEIMLCGPDDPKTPITMLIQCNNESMASSEAARIERVCFLTCEPNGIKPVDDLTCHVVPMSIGANLVPSASFNLCAETNCQSIWGYGSGRDKPASVRRPLMIWYSCGLSVYLLALSRSLAPLSPDRQIVA